MSRGRDKGVVGQEERQTWPAPGVSEDLEGTVCSRPRTGKAPLLEPLALAWGWLRSLRETERPKSAAK